MKTTHVRPIFLVPSNGIPNNPELPLLLYKQVLQQQEDLVSAFKKAFAQNNWVGTWTNGVFDYHHYHSVAHEVLGVAAGTATLLFGGPGGEEIEVRAGDMVVLPAGTGHCRKQASSDFKVVGAYPPGQQNYDICTATDDMAEKQNNIASVSLPTTDPISGKEGPLHEHWLEKDT